MLNDPAFNLVINEMSMRNFINMLARCKVKTVSNLCHANTFFSGVELYKGIASGTSNIN